MSTRNATPRPKRYFLDIRRTVTMRAGEWPLTPSIRYEVKDSFHAPPRVVFETKSDGLAFRICRFLNHEASQS